MFIPCLAVLIRRNYDWTTLTKETNVVYCIGRVEIQIEI